jgi:hypothetical protein
MRPMQYTDDGRAGFPEPRASAPDLGSDDTDEVEGAPAVALRMESARTAKLDAKLTGPWVDNTPLRYRDGDPEHEFGLDDQDELTTSSNSDPGVRARAMPTRNSPPTSSS